MVALDAVVGIDLSVRIERIGSDPFQGFGAGVVAIPDFASYPQDRASHAIANIRDLASL